jgi:putative membrane protein insertion efficiency factor
VEKYINKLILNILQVLLVLKKQLLPSGVCRFTPTCSQYAVEAFSNYPPMKAAYLSFLRLVRCNPFFSGGDDPVPHNFSNKKVG